MQLCGGIEGHRYVWTAAEIVKLLGMADRSRLIQESLCVSKLS